MKQFLRTHFTGIPSTNPILSKDWLPEKTNPYFVPWENCKESVIHHAAWMDVGAPQFQRLFMTKWGAAWIGEVPSAFQLYRVLIVYQTKGTSSDVRYKSSGVRAYVLSPVLTDREGRPDRFIPHLYREGHLCLHHPRRSDFDDDKGIIPHELLPWISEWLLNYEIWLATGEWAAQDAHPPNSDAGKESICVENPKIYSPLIFKGILTASMPYVVRYVCQQNATPSNAVRSRAA